MAITFVGSATGSIGLSGTSFNITYTSTGGNFLFLAVSCAGGPVFTVSDSANNAWTQLSTSLSGGEALIFYSINTSAITLLTVTLSASSNPTSAVLGEYSGANSLLGVPATTVITGGLPGPIDVSKSLIVGNNWFIASMGAVTSTAGSLTSVIGNLRSSVTQSYVVAGTTFHLWAALVDNTSGSPGTIHDAINFPGVSAGGTGAIAVEVSPNVRKYPLMGIKTSGVSGSSVATFLHS